MPEEKELNLSNEYEYGFHDEDTSVFKTQKGLNEEVVRTISKIKKEPEWMLELSIESIPFFRGTKESKMGTGFKPN